MDFVQARQLFPGLNNKTFLDSACVSLIPTTAKVEMIKFLDLALECPSRDASIHHIAMDTWRQNTTTEVAKLFNVTLERVSLIESTTHGINIAVNAIPFEKGDEVIIIDTEFLQVSIPFMKREERGGLKVVPIMGGDDFVNLQMIEEKISTKTKAICISSVQWCNGYHFPMRDLGKLCQERGVWLIVDAVHEAGVLNVDLKDRYCDFYISGGHKWLNSPYGCGIMILSSKAMELSPPSYGYLALAEPEGGWGAFFQDPKQTPFREYNYPPNAKKFEIAGTSNYPGAIGLASAIKIVNQLTIQRVEERVLSLVNFLRTQLQQTLPVKFVSPGEVALQSGITVFKIFDDPKKDQELLESLLDEKILVSIRYTANKGGIRVSTHYFNNEEDILKLSHTINKILKTK